jgi:hypothetical protein
VAGRTKWPSLARGTSSFQAPSTSNPIVVSADLSSLI